MPVINEYTTEEYKQRVATALVDNKPNMKCKVIIRLDAALPMLIISDNLIKDTKVYEMKVSGVSLSGTAPQHTADSKTTTLTAKITLKDEEYEASAGHPRYVYVGSAASPQTRNKVSFYYDDKLKDMFVIPAEMMAIADTALLKPVDSFYVINGYVIGGLVETDSTTDAHELSYQIPVSAAIHHDLPTISATPTLDIVTYGCIVTGTNKSNNYKSLELARILSDGSQVNTTMIDFINIIELGLPSKVFGGSDAIPRYQVYQMSPSTYRQVRYGLTNLASKIRVALAF